MTSSIWKGMHWIHELINLRSYCKIGVGNINIWHDPWVPSPHNKSSLNS